MNSWFKVKVLGIFVQRILPEKRYSSSMHKMMHIFMRKGRQPFGA